MSAVEPVVPGPATPLERGAAAMEVTPEGWRRGADELHLLPAARLVVSLDRAARQFPGDPRRPGSTRDKKARARLGGALAVWEAMTGQGVGHAYDVVEARDRAARQVGFSVPTTDPSAYAGGES